MNFDPAFGIEHAALLSLTGVATVYDLWRREIPNELTVIGAMFGIGFALGRTFGVPSEPLGAALIALVCGMLVAACVSLPLWRTGALGGGDVKLLLVAGTLLGPLPMLRLLGCSLLIFVLLSAGRFLRQGRLAEALRRSCSPFRAELELGGELTLAGTNDQAESAAVVARLVPFAPAMFLASFVVIWA